MKKKKPMPVEPEKAKPLEPEPEQVEPKGKFHGGKRYVIGLQSKKEPCLYSDQVEKDTFSDACDTAKACAEREGRPCIVFDRRAIGDPVTYRTNKE